MLEKKYPSTIPPEWGKLVTQDFYWLPDLADSAPSVGLNWIHICVACQWLEAIIKPCCCLRVWLKAGDCSGQNHSYISLDVGMQPRLLNSSTVSTKNTKAASIDRMAWHGSGLFLLLFQLFWQLSKCHLPLKWCKPLVWKTHTGFSEVTTRGNTIAQRQLFLPLDPHYQTIQAAVVTILRHAW